MRERVRARACHRGFLSGNLAVWPLDSRRVAWPHLCTLGWRLGDTRVEWSAIYPVPALSTCYRCPRDALEEFADDQSDKHLLWALFPGGPLPAYEPRRQGGRECECAVAGVGRGPMMIEERRKRR